MKIFIKKHCYIVIPAVTIIIFIILKCNNLIIIPEDENDRTVLADYLSTLVGISGTLIGFLFTAITIFLSLNKDTQYMQNFKKYNHHIIFGRLVTLGIAILSINIILWLFSFDKFLIMASFIIGLEETLMAAYYIYKLSLNSFK
jgi:hypothetical protein|nr:MAG TPA: hypothetical protein [Caudoviricetes sp.]